MSIEEEPKEGSGAPSGAAPRKGASASTTTNQHSASSSSSLSAGNGSTLAAAANGLAMAATPSDVSSSPAAAPGAPASSASPVPEPAANNGNRRKKSRVLGPRSALTSFLEERGIKAKNVGQWGDRRRVSNQNQNSAAQDGTGEASASPRPEAGPPPPLVDVDATAAGEEEGEAEDEEGRAAAMQAVHARKEAAALAVKKRKARAASKMERADVHVVADATDEDDLPLPDAKTATSKTRTRAGKQPVAVIDDSDDDDSEEDEDDMEVDDKADRKGKGPAKRGKTPRNKDAKGTKGKMPMKGKGKRKGGFSSSSSSSASSNEDDSSASESEVKRRNLLRKRSMRSKASDFISLCRVCSTQFTYDPSKSAEIPVQCAICSEEIRQNMEKASTKTKGDNKAKGKKKKARFSELLEMDTVASKAEAAAQAMPSLQAICVAFLSANIDAVESFGVISAASRNRICRIICRHRQLRPETVPLFFDPDQTELRLYDCAYLSDALLGSIGAYNPSLTSLHLYQIGTLMPATVIQLAASTPHLTQLTLSGGFLLTDDALGAALAHWPRLRLLTIEHVPKLGEKTIAALAQHCTELRSLRLHFCSRLTDAQLKPIVALKALVKISLDGTTSLTEAAFRDILFPAFAAQLQVLKVGNLDETIFHGDTMRAFVSHLPADPAAVALRKLVLRWVPGVDDSCIGHWQDRIQRLTELHIERTLNITPAVLNTFVKTNPRLETLVLDSCLHEHDHEDMEAMLLQADSPSQLRVVNVSWARGVSDVILEGIVRKNPHLTHLSVWGCHRVTSWWTNRVMHEGIRRTTLNQPAQHHKVSFTGTEAEEEEEEARRFVHVTGGPLIEEA